MVSEKKSKVILTGGHLAPLLAVLPLLSKKADCVVIGRRHTFEGDKTESLEYKVLSDMKIPFYPIKAGRLQRKISAKSIPSLMRSPGAFLRARNIIKREKPDVVLTFGGYVGLPVALAAYSKGIPVILHEQTMAAGLTNRAISKFATKTLISYFSSAPFFPPEKTVLTGNPVRPEIFMADKKMEIDRQLPLLFVTGGSAGAHAINTYVETLLPKLLSHFAVIHQTGDSQTFNDFDKLEKIKKALPADLQKAYVIKKFILPEEIGWIYKNAEVVLSRAGANTVTELLTLCKKAVLIPLPHGQKSEQLINARFYEESGLGTYIEEKDIDVGLLLAELLKLAKKNIKPQLRAKNEAAERIVEETLKEARKVIE